MVKSWGSLLLNPKGEFLEGEILGVVKWPGSLEYGFNFAQP